MNQSPDHPFAHLESPYVWYDQIRQPPVYSQAFGGWLVTRAEDIRWILEHPDLFSAKDTLSPLTPFPPAVLEILAGGYPPVPAVQNSDGALHHRLRTLVEQAILPRFKSLRPVLIHLAQALVDQMIDQGRVDLMEHFALPFPFAVLCHLLDIPERDQATFRQLCDDTLLLFSASVSPQLLPVEQQQACASSFVTLQSYLGHLSEDRRKAPGDDVISALLLGSAPGVAPLEDAELMAVLIDLVFGGYKTTASLIGNSVALLLQTPEAWQHLLEHPKHIALALEECLRYDAPVPAMVRTTTQEVLLPDSSQPIPPDTLLLLLYAAANHDSDQFPHPTLVQMQRKPNRHLSFGHGIHLCVGAPLARLESQIALETLTQRLPKLGLVSKQPFQHVPTIMYRMYERLEVAWQ